MLVEEDGAPIAALSVANYIRTVRLNTTGRRLLWKLTWSDGRESDSWLEEVPWDVRPHDTFVLPEATNNSGFGDFESEDEAASLFSMRWWKPAPTARVAAPGHQEADERPRHDQMAPQQVGARPSQHPRADAAQLRRRPRQRQGGGGEMMMMR